MDEATKICPKCERELPATTEYFYSNKRRPDGISGWCRECTCEYDRTYRASHKEKRHEQTKRYYTKHRDECIGRSLAYHAKNREHVQALENERRRNHPAAIAFREWRSRGCLVCGESDYRIIHAHHINRGEKDYSPHQIKDVDVLMAELEKCVPLCVNHHMLLHIEQGNGHKGCTTAEVVEFLKESTNAQMRVVA